MKQNKYLFIDSNRIFAPSEGVGSVEIEYSQASSFLPGIFIAFDKLKRLNFKFVILRKLAVTGINDVLESKSRRMNQFLVDVFASQEITFDEILVYASPECDDDICKFPQEVLLKKYVVEQIIDRKNSYAIGGQLYSQLAESIGINYLNFEDQETNSWRKISQFIEKKPRIASFERRSTETSVSLHLNLDDSVDFEIDTGINFLNHLIEQLVKHAGIGMRLKVKGDLHIDDHHTVEDIAIVIGSAIRKALGDKLGINRFGFVLPLDEAKTLVTIDLSNRPHCAFKGTFKTEMIGDLSTQMVEHFFHSFADGLRASLHVEIEGSNSHHMSESAFKALGRALRQAVKLGDEGLPSTKGLL
jgi:imidazoleglycerol-phosphate dehydratase / histidinol-phosphatase